MFSGPNALVANNIHPFRYLFVGTKAVFCAVPHGIGDLIHPLHGADFHHPMWHGGGIRRGETVRQDSFRVLATAVNDIPPQHAPNFPIVHGQCQANDTSVRSIEMPGQGCRDCPVFVG